ncbi:GTPase IMAP family member 4-like [Astyanax mexicanus]|uniref:GTPase IMAP family member 4-like n=1 Tax=Astyanax mexicanus TaxID=7994 RepID=UPI0020CAA1E3|nr:GTPase IMAP family member 4-like [Astyanax mexicanus]
MASSDVCEELRIILLGKNSSEISRVGNFILGRKAFNTEAPPPSVEQNLPNYFSLPKTWNLVLCGREAETKASVSKLLVEKNIEVCGRLISLVELPALYSSQLSEEEVMQETFCCVSLCDPGVHAFLLVLPEGRLTDEDKGELEKIQNIFGTGLKSLSLVLIAQPLQNKELDESVKKIINSFGGRFIFFDIKTDSANLMTCLKVTFRENPIFLVFCGIQ